MQISITGHHLDITDALKQYIESKFSKLERHFSQLTQIHVILTVEKLQQKAEATVHFGGANIFAEDHQEDMYTAIDGLVDKLDRQLKKQKEKLTHHR
ncbi:MAG: ribosome-associated translation inhibitor RaiA [Methylococcales bacterium]